MNDNVDEDGYYNFDQQNENINALIGPQDPIKNNQENSYNDTDDESEEESLIEEVEPIKEDNEDEEKLTQYRSAKYSDKDIEKLNKIAKAYGLNDSEALRLCIKMAWDTYGVEIEKLAKEVEKFERRMKKIRSL
ncbi:MAG: hypothetical protein PHO87_05070 [Acholeplasmataceae bacterium]|nr:hypothetical protein [Acholeplasmataceae bacterium]